MGGMMGGGTYGYGSLGTIGLILNFVITIGVIVGIVLLIVWLVRRVSSDAVGGAIRGGLPSGQSSAKEILQVRYARGEIDREQYQEMLGDLT